MKDNEIKPGDFFRWDQGWGYNLPDGSGAILFTSSNSYWPTRGKIPEKATKVVEGVVPISITKIVQGIRETLIVVIFDKHLKSENIAKCAQVDFGKLNRSPDHGLRVFGDGDQPAGFPSKFMEHHTEWNRFEKAP